MTTPPLTPHFMGLRDLVERLLPDLRRAAGSSPRLDGLTHGPTPHWKVATFDHAGFTWAVAGDTRFEPLEIAYRALVGDPLSEPFLVREVKTQMKLVLRSDLDALRQDRGRGAAYLYIYAPKRSMRVEERSR